MTDSGLVKLRAHDSEDLVVIASLLQDALVPVVDMRFLAKEKRFVLVANRFDWSVADAKAGKPAPAGDAAFEDAEEEPPFRRINCGLCFDRVRNVKSRGLNPDDREQILNLLTITGDDRSVTLYFSGGAAVRLGVSAIRCHLEDLGEAWPTRWRPEHSADVSEAQAETDRDA
ncbi:MAG: DUF2948 family protein [Kiloniellales bacterium]|nr:DUF2948 family protein [Kiloniellales bacterium]